jgi:hypothetical protein
MSRTSLPGVVTVLVSGDSCPRGVAQTSPFPRGKSRRIRLAAAGREALAGQTPNLREGAAMIRKALSILVSAGVTLLLASQWNDIKRYLRIKQPSMGQGHPENVPAEGRKVYPQRPGDGATDGTGDFASASRGGPVWAR